MRSGHGFARASSSPAKPAAGTPSWEPDAEPSSSGTQIAVRFEVHNRVLLMKLLHAADIHLDSPMRGLAKYDGAPVAELHGATRRALGNLVDLAIDEHVSVVLLAGDLFDGDWPHYGTGVHFVKEMGRLREAGIEVVSIGGNHDAESKLTKSLRLPDNVHVLGTKRAETKVFEELGLAVHGQGYATSAVLEDLSIGYPAPVKDLLNVGLLHTCAGGRAGHGNYAPCRVEALREFGYDYWALGHVHSHEMLSDTPPVVFPGMLQGRGLRETGPKGAVLVEFEDGQAVRVEHRVLDAVRWEAITIQATDCSTRDQVCDRARAEMRRALEAADGRLLAARVVISGECDAHQELLADPGALRYEMLAAAADVAGDLLWVEGVEVSTSPIQPAAAPGSDAVGELLRELEELVADDAAIDELAQELRPLAEALPPGVCRGWVPTDRDTVREVLVELAGSLPSVLLESREP